MEAYARALATASDTSGAEAAAAVRRVMDAFPGSDVATVRTAAIQAVTNSATRYGNATSALAAELFDEVMEAEGVEAPRAEAWDGPDSDAISQGVRYQAGKLAAGDAEGFLDGVSELASYHTSRAANTTIARNVRRSGGGVRYARVPTRADPCPYCLMLASRGFAYRSEQTAGAASHRHCTCALVPGIPGKTQVGGYDPADLYRRWRDGGSSTEAHDQAKSSGALSGALGERNDPDGSRRLAHAERYFEEIRNRDTDAEVRRVSENTGIDEETVRTAYEHLFVEEHDLEGGRRRFDPDYYEAESWRRLSTGDDIQGHDLTLVMHEAQESRLMADGMGYSEAHRTTCSEFGYDYPTELTSWLRGRGGDGNADVQQGLR